ncbi:hypothetical protein [Salimicrobium halophilum]|uniref:DUF5668 domain-containing protein n=1 Tax=Salimicrobium halophilum TaxID=86666 RepID=A0A1G8PI26_9BACI|nr:hypothetical protein [Salimicrobium halophilum]SDI92171.1 hypothetical protein SAMN04490247_0008 [Salimicrobium halophilum]
MKRYYFLLAIILSAVGLHFFLEQIPIPVIQNWGINGSLLLFLFIGLFIHARRARDEILAFFSSFLLLVLWQNYTEANIGIWPTHWGVYIIYIGVALALARKQKIAIIPIAIGLGILFIPAIESLFFFVPTIIRYIETYYSILFLLLAGYYFYQQK